MPERKTALITGASAGIGAAFARVFAERGFDLVITARRRQRLDALACELGSAGGVDVLVLPEDLADPDAPERLHAEIVRAGRHIDALVNNAGYGLRGTFASRAWPEHAAFVQVMMASVLHLTHLFEQEMVARGYGRIINVASLAGLVPPSARHTLYSPVKAFIISFSEALAQEHVGDGVNVTALCPGYTYTEFHDVMGNRSQVSRLPRLLWTDAYRVAAEGYDAVMAGKTVHIVGRTNRLLAGLVQALPSSLVRAVVAKQWKRVRSD